MSSDSHTDPVDDVAAPTGSAGPEQTGPAGRGLYEAYRQAETLLAGGDALRALAVLEPVLDAATDDVSVQLLAARAFFRSAQLARAEDAFRRVVDLDPTDHYARYGLGRTLERRNRRDEAASHYRVAAALDPRVEYAEALWRVT